MKDLAFFNAGCHRPRGVHRHLMVVVRRVLRRVLRPIFLHQLDLFRALFERLYEAELGVEALRAEIHHLRVAGHQMEEHLKATQEQVNTVLAFGWDYVALVRRLAALEDQVAALTGSQATEPGDIAESCSSILFPGLEKLDAGPASPGAHAKVCSY